MLTDGFCQRYTLWKDVENPGKAGKTMLKMFYLQLKIDLLVKKLDKRQAIVKHPMDAQ